MATKAEVLAAMRRKLGKKSHPVVETRRGSVSAARRTELRAEREELREQMTATEAPYRETRSVDYWAAQLADAAQFLLDLPADQEEPRRQLAQALAGYQARVAIVDERKRLRKRISAVTELSTRRKYRASDYNYGIKGFPMSLVVAEADTLDELLAKVKSS